MKSKKSLILFAAAAFMFGGCGLYNKYQPNGEVQAINSKISPVVYGSIGTDSTVWASPASDVVLAKFQSQETEAPSWRDFFTDPLLQQLIEEVLANNTDMHSARIAVEKSEASLKAARMAFLPSLYFSPQGTLAKFDKNPWSKTYTLPLQLSMDVDVFGSITNKKRAAKAVLLQAQVREEAVQANLISATAQQYYLLQLLDRQLEILVQTDSLWKASLEIEKTLWENGKIYSTAVNQLESSYLNVKTQIVDVRRTIRSVENSLCSLLADTPQHIRRSPWGNFDFPSFFSASYLLNRPDIRLMNFSLEEAFYNTQAARAAFFPSISLSGSAGWTNSAGSMVVNPGKLLFNALASLTQPIFARGKLSANLKIAKLTEEDLLKKYVQTVIDAGNQVNEALADCQAAHEKYAYYRRQVEVLHQAYVGT